MGFQDVKKAPFRLPSGKELLARLGLEMIQIRSGKPFRDPVAQIIHADVVACKQTASAFPEEQATVLMGAFPGDLPTKEKVYK